MRRGASSLVSLAQVLVLCASVVSAQVPLPIQFRTGVTLVPLEVRVVDKDGNPVTDLTIADFAVRDGGALQKLEHFEAVSSATATQGRTFVVVLGRGRLREPTKPFQALLSFLRTQTLPQDRVGVVAYLRAVEPTVDRESVSEFIRTYAECHEMIEGRIARDQRQEAMGLLRPLSPTTKKAIDELFDTVRLPVRDLAGADGGAVDQYNDFRYLKNTLEYLRSVDGEKHAIFVSQRPFGLGVVEDDPRRNFWFRLATAARASISYIHAGGQPLLPMSGGRLRQGPLLTGLHPGVVARYEVATHQTGGMTAFFQFADKPLAALERSTRFHYLLGYYPTESLAPDAYRRITISVRREGVRLLYRQGYVARAAPEAPEDYRTAVTEARLDAAAAFLVNPLPVDETTRLFRWRLRLERPLWTPSESGGAGGRIQVTVSFEPREVAFGKAGAQYYAELDFVLLADDDKRGVLGEQRVRLPFRLSPTEFQRTSREWLSYDATVDAIARPAYLRAVLYDFSQDRVASAQLRLPR